MYNNNIMPYNPQMYGLGLQSPIAQMQQPQQQNILPRQGILTASGYDSIKQIKMQPNDAVLIVDTTENIIWRCVSDGLGNVTPTRLRVFEDEITDKKPDMSAEIQSTLTEIKEMLMRMEEVKNEQSGSRGTKSAKRNSSADGAESTTG